MKESPRLYATALGLYNIEINGQTVGTQVLKPGSTSYRHRQYFQTFDVPLGSILFEGMWPKGGILDLSGSWEEDYRPSMLRVSYRKIAVLQNTVEHQSIPDAHHIEGNRWVYPQSGPVSIITCSCATCSKWGGMTRTSRFPPLSMTPLINISITVNGNCSLMFDSRRCLFQSFFWRQWAPSLFNHSY